MNLPHFKPYTKADLFAGTKLRRFETKLGERLQVIQDTITAEVLRNAKETYIVFGISEDLGVLANEGKTGTSTAWQSFVQAFLNIQSNDFLNGETIAIAGYFDFSNLQALILKNAMGEEEMRDACRHAVQQIDNEVEKLVKAIVATGKIPVVIGGGHNNAYPLIKGAAKGLQQAQQSTLLQINCINLDAHADYRPEEGRHSGNAFRYAETDGFLQKYFVVGIHENYLQQNVWTDMVANPFLDFITYEDIFIHEKQSFRQAVMQGIRFTEENFTGIELDMDSIENVLSSAMTPCGVTVVQARQYITYCAAYGKPVYLYICEGATTLCDGKKNEATGKMLSYLVSDFIKMHQDVHSSALQ